MFYFVVVVVVVVVVVQLFVLKDTKFIRNK